MKRSDAENILYLKEEGIDYIYIGRKKTLSKRTRLLSVKEEVDSCRKCPELVSNRTNVVFGAGVPSAKIVFVGEAPGRDEDIQGKPFVGRSGKLLTKMIREILGMERERVFIANVLKCRPPNNRNPLSSEIINCEPYLIRQIEIIKPKVICALGTFAAQTLLRTDKSISSLRGKFHDYCGIKLLPTFHPAYLLRNPAQEYKAVEDFKMLKKELDS